MNKKFSIITSVYKNDKPEFVRVALDSMLVNQSVKPTEVVLVQDGPVPDGLSELLAEYETKYPEVMNIIRLEKNGGLGNALKLGTETAKYYSKGEFLGNKEYDTAVPKKYTCNGKWYESLSEENKSKCVSSKITLTFNPEIVILDTTSTAYIKKETYTTTTINGYEYINSITFNMDSESSEVVKFYKANTNMNYTYPIINDNSIITFNHTE